MKMGRPTNLTPEVQTEICNALQVGCTTKTAYESAGVPRTTFFKWLNKGRKGEPGYVDFGDAVKKARAVGRKSCVTTIRRSAETSWQAAAWLLERTAPEEYGANAKEIRELKKQVAEVLELIKIREMV